MADPDVSSVSPLQQLTFQDLVTANLSRVVRWHPNGLQDWSPLEWAGAMAGEAGEACNAAKKLKRVDDQIANINHEAGRSLTERAAATKQIAKEVADTIIYGALLVSAVGEDLAATLAEVFNRKSEEYGFPERLPLAALAAPVVPPSSEDVFTAGWNAAKRDTAAGDDEDIADAADVAFLDFVRQTAAPVVPHPQERIHELATKEARRLHEHAVYAASNGHPDQGHVSAFTDYWGFAACPHPDCVLVHAASRPRAVEPPKEQL